MINEAYAQTVEVPSGDLTPMANPNAPSATEAFIWNIGLVLILVAMFYLLLIRPQQKRFKEHAEMLSALKKGDRVVTSGGLIGKVDKLVDDREVVIDLGSGMKVTALRSAIQASGNDVPGGKPANDSAKDKKKA